ncbi:MAG: VWA domain-containing protein [Alphaproteobacteria bacterium]|nr:VWA domain-containing protein [Alphaproteobacteria bacterium]
MITFEYPYFALLLVVPFFIRMIKTKASRQKDKALKVPFIKDIKNVGQMKSNFNVFEKGKYFDKTFLALMSCFVFIVLALMQPVKTGEPERLNNKGRDILLVTDISTSMLEEDFEYNHRRLSRMEAVRAVVSDFVKNRANDRLGLILFGTRAYLQAPITFDKQAVIDILDTMKAGMAGQSTAIGDALALALKTLRGTKTDKDNQVIILLTDGENNDGKMSVAEAIELAKGEGVKVYTIGVGSPQMSLVDAFFGIQNSGLDEQALKELAAATKGRYFKVTTLKELVDVYKKIDALEEQNFEDYFLYPKTELYYIFVLIALCLGLVFLLPNLFKGKEQ